MIRESDEGLLVDFRIVPNSSRNEITVEDEFVKVKLTAQPIENKANKALAAFLSKEFKIPKTSVLIVRGASSKDKVVLFKVSDSGKRNELRARLTK